MEGVAAQVALASFQSPPHRGVFCSRAWTLRAGSLLGISVPSSSGNLLIASTAVKMCDQGAPHFSPLLIGESSDRHQEPRRIEELAISVPSSSGNLLIAVCCAVARASVSYFSPLLIGESSDRLRESRQAAPFFIRFQSPPHRGIF